MARAKRTDRAEARRRYRASLIDQDPDETDEAEDGVEPEASPSSARASAPSTPAAPVRPSLASAFRASIRPLDVRSDLQALPRLLIHRSVWLPVLLTIASAAAYLLAPGNFVGVLLFQYFVYYPPVASIFLAGFLAPRASYLTGLVAGVVGAIAFSVVGFVVSGQVPPPATSTQPGAVSIEQAIGVAFLVSPISGVLFGGAAGWYRRFLSLANPNRASRRPPPKPPGQRRKGSEGRPALARRR